MTSTEKSVAQPTAYSSAITEAVLANLQRDSLYKLKPWRQEADECRQRRSILYARAENPETRGKLKKAFVERMKSNNPFTQELSFILMTLLYSETSHPHVVLADMLINMSAAERLGTHNWWVQNNANELIQESMSTAIASGNLAFPLFPGTEMDTQNRCMMEEAVEVRRPADTGVITMEGGGLSGQTMQLYYPKSRALFAHPPPTTKVLRGGEPFIPVLDGNKNQAGYWDGAPVKERFDQLQREIQNLHSELRSVRAFANNGGGNYAGRGSGSNRRGRGDGNGQRGVRRSGRGGGYNYRMYGGDADEDDEGTYTGNQTMIGTKN